MLVERFFHFSRRCFRRSKARVRHYPAARPHIPCCKCTIFKPHQFSFHRVFSTGSKISADPSNALQTVPIYVLDFLNLAQRRRCAAAILARLFADIFRRFRLGSPLLYAPANAVSAALGPDNCFSTRSLSFFNCPMIEDTFPMRVPPRSEIVAEDRVAPFKRTSMRDEATNLMFQSV